MEGELYVLPLNRMCAVFKRSLSSDIVFNKIMLKDGD